jgi:mannosyltransferase
MATPELTAGAGSKGRTSVGRHTRILDMAAIGAAAAASLALVVPGYARRPFWFDELVSIEAAGLSPRSLADYVFSVEANMALYHGVLNAWLGVTTDESGVRALSIALALLVLPFVYALASQMYGRLTALIAVLLMSVNVSYVGYSRDARSYALTLLLVTASSYFLVRASDRSRTSDWALYVVTAALAVWAHLFAALVVAAQLAWILLEPGPAVRRRGLTAVACVVAVALPLGLAVVVGGQRPQLDWLPRPGPQKLPGLFQWFVESRATVVVYFIGGVVALVTALAAWRRGSERWPRRESLLLLWLLLPPMVAFAISYATPLYLYRYFLFCLPALVIFVASGFGRMRPVGLGVVFTALAVVLSVRTVESCRPDCKIRHDEWRAASDYLQARTRPDDAIVIYPAQVRTPLDHYLSEERPALLYPERWGLVGGVAEGADDLDSAVRRATAHPRVWLVTWWLPAERARIALGRHAELVSTREFQGNVHIALYRPREPGV